jgi:DNA-binding NtrC family response regulator
MSSILLVDDEKNVLKTLSISLRRYDFAVQQAQNGPDALKILEESPCDFVVSDIRMTPMDGYKLATAIRRRYPDIHIIFMSAYGSDERNGRPEGLENFPRLTKPFPVADLVRILHEKQSERSGRISPNEAPHRLLLFGEGEQGDRIFKQLRSMGFTVELHRPDDDDPRIEKNRFDLFVFDGRMLDGHRWTLLNKIDRAAPQKPVLVIADCENGAGQATETDASPAVINRRLFFDAPDRTREFILAHLRSK